MTKHPSIERAGRRRGSVMILVVAMLVLLVLAGTAYMQRARLDRMSTEQAANKGSIDRVAAAAIEQIKGVLRDDLIDTAGATPQFLNPAAPAFDEPYDYPWTNAASTFDVATQYQQRWNFKDPNNPVDPIQALGGRLDDMWLASSCPTDLDTDRNGTIDTYGWEHITNLTGIYLDLPRPTAKEGSKLPIEWVISKATSGPGNWDTYAAANPDVPQANTNTAQTDSNLPLFNNAGNLPNQNYWTLTTATDPTDAATINRPKTVDGVDYAADDDYQPRGYDVDGDGVPDSRWTWAPIRQVNGIDYVMAVRIIDNSSMINVNAASAQTSDGTNNFLSPAIAGWPTSADLSRLMRRAGPSGNNRWIGSISALFSRRQLIKPEGNVNPIAYGGIFFAGGNVQMIRANAGVPGEAAAYWGAPYDPTAPGGPWWPGLINYGGYGRDPAWFGPDDEIAMRLGNGVRSARFGKTPLETYIDDYGSKNGLGLAHLPGSTRWEQEEDNFLQVRSTSYNPATDFNRANVREFFEGIGSDPTSFQPLTQRTFPDIRKWLTTWSGADELTGMWGTLGANEARLSAFPLPPQDFTAGGGSVTATQRTSTRYVLPNVVTAGDNNDVIDLRNRIERILRIGALGSTSYQGMAAPELEATAAWMSSAIYNASSDSYRPQGIQASSGGATTYYALKRLPFIREVYLQGRYQALDTGSGPGPGTLLWKFESQTQALAIEVGNPFDQEIDLGALSGDLEIAVVQPSGQKGIWKPTLTSKLAPGASLVFYMNPLDTTASETGGSSNQGNALDANLGLPAASVNLGSHIAFEASENVQIQLRITPAGGGTAVTYDRLENPSLSIGGADGTLADLAQPNDHSHAQVAYARACQFGTDVGPYYLSNLGQGQVDNRLPGVGPYKSSVWRFGNDNKGFASPGAIARYQGLRLWMPQRPLISAAELASLPILGFSDGQIGGIGSSAGFSFPDWLDYYANNAPASDPRYDAYRPDPVGNPGEQIVKRLFLDFSPTATIPAQAGVPHAALVLEALSTISPQFDGIDNDSDDGDNDLRTNADGDGLFATGRGAPELFVPGRININTAPMHVIAMAAPLPEPLDQIQAMAQSIVMFRNASEGDPGPTRRSNWTIFSAGVPTALGRINGTDVRGIVSLGELLTLQPTLAAASISPYLQAIATSAQPELLNMNRWASLAGAIPLRTAAAPTPEEFSVVDGVTPVISQIAGSAQKRAARLRYLNQVFTTRSDVYTAYIEIRGYPSDDYRKGPVERTRMIVVFDRGGVVGPANWPAGAPNGPRPDTHVRIVAMYQY